MLSYIFSVSICKGWYRHIRISADNSLHCLALIIGEAFELGKIDNYIFSLNHINYYNPESGKETSADKIKLNEIIFNKGEIFPFFINENWYLKCKFLRSINERTEKPVVIRAVGENPEESFDENYDYIASEKFKGGEYTELKTMSDNLTYDLFVHCLPLNFIQPSDEIMKAAFSYKKYKSLSSLKSIDWFAVKLSDNRIAYCYSLRKGTNNIELTISVGNENIAYMNSISKYSNLNPPYESRFLLNYISLCFSEQHKLPHPIVNITKDYASRNNIKLKGKYSYVSFEKYKPFQCMKYISQQEDYDIILQVLNAVKYLSERLESSDKKSLGFDIYNNTLPLISKSDNEFKITPISYPIEYYYEYDTPILTSDELINKINQLKKKGVWEFSHCIFPNEVVNMEKNDKLYPVFTITSDTDKRCYWDTDTYEAYPEANKKLIIRFAENIVKYGICPEKIKVRSTRAAAFLKDICSKCEIKLEHTTDELYTEFLHEMTVYDIDTELSIDELIKTVSNNENSKTVTKRTRSLLFDILENGILPPHLEKKLRNFLEN